MPRPAKWSGPTVAIRVPKRLAPVLMAMARLIDAHPEYGQDFDYPYPQMPAYHLYHLRTWCDGYLAGVTCPLLAGPKVGDRVWMGDRVGKLAIVHDAADKPYVAIRWEDAPHLGAQAWNRGAVCMARWEGSDKIRRLAA
jgi:hypothetical protein